MRSRLAWAALTAAGLAVLLAVLLVRSVPPASPDRSEHYSHSHPVPLLPGTEVDQEITVQADSLAAVEARFGTYGGARHCRIDVTLTDEAGGVVADRPLLCGAIADNVLTVVARPSGQGLEPGDRLTLRFQAAPEGTEAVALWVGTPGDSAVASLDGRSLGGAAELYTRYGDKDPLLERVGSVLARAGQYGPWWGTPPATVALFSITLAGLVVLVLVPARRRLAVLLVVVAAKGVLWSVVLPPLEVPDEPAHFAYAQYVAEEQAIPRRSDSPDHGEPFSAQLRAAIEVTNQARERPGDRPTYGTGGAGPDEQIPDSAARTSDESHNPSAGYPPLYYLGAAAAYALPPIDFFTSLATMRLWSVALGVATIWLVVAIGRRAFRNETAALALGVAVAFQPVWSQATAGVNNDAAVVLAGAGCTLVALDLARRPGHARLPLMAGAVLGLALLTKPYAAAFVVPMGVGWLLGRRHGTGRGWLRDVGQAVVGVAGTFGTWLVVSAALGIPMVTTGDAERGTGNRTPGGYLHELTRDGYHALHLNWVERLWANLSWTDTPLPSTVVAVIARVTVGVLVVAALWIVVTVVDLVRGKTAGLEGEAGTDLDVTLVLGVAVVSTFALLHLVELSWFIETGNATLLSGRYALMALPAILAATPLMLRRLVPRLSPWIPMVALAGAVVALNVIGLDTLVRRFYI
jgi:hypothetical protein